MSFVYHNDADLAKPLFALFTRKDVNKDEELTFSYAGEGADEDELEEVMKRQEPLVRNDTHVLLASLTCQPTIQPKGQVYQKCMCGARNCRGFLFR